MKLMYPSTLFAAGLLLAGCTTMEAQIRSSGSMGAPDAQFVSTAYDLVQLDRQEGELAKTKAADPRVLDLATQVQSQADALDPGLQAAGNVEGIKPPAQLPSEEAAEIDRLRTLNGPAFDRQYVADELAAHKRALPVFQNEDSTTQDAAMRNEVETALPALQSNLDKLQFLSTEQTQGHS